jgi:hypothetical protein
MSRPAFRMEYIYLSADDVRYLHQVIVHHVREMISE